MYNLSNMGFDEIASCKYDKNELMGVSLFISDLEIEKSSYSAELLRCIYNEGHNFGTFRVALDRFANQIHLLKMPYEAVYIESSQSSEDFIWIHNYYSKDYSDQISVELLNNKGAIEINQYCLQIHNLVTAKCIH